MSGTITSLEDKPYSLKVSDFGFTDPNDNPANSLMAVKIATLPGLGTLVDNGVAVMAGQFIPVLDIGAGNLKYTAVANSNGANYTSFTFQVQDNGGTANGGIDTDPTPRTMTVNVASVNDAPIGTSGTISCRKINHIPLKASDFGFTDPNDTPGQFIAGHAKITTLPAMGTLTDNGTAQQQDSSYPWRTSPHPIGGSLPLRMEMVRTIRTSRRLQVQDNGGTANGGVDTDPTPRTMTLSTSHRE